MDKSVDRLRWIEHKGKKIIYADYRGLTSEDEMVFLLEDTASLILASPDKVLILNNFTDVEGTEKYLSNLERLKNKYSLDPIEKAAIVGLSPIRAFLLKSYYYFLGFHAFRTFGTEEAALEWLVG